MIAVDPRINQSPLLVTDANLYSSSLVVKHVLLPRIYIRLYICIHHCLNHKASFQALGRACCCTKIKPHIGQSDSQAVSAVSIHKPNAICTLIY
jgi:hypothetical protein